MGDLGEDIPDLLDRVEAAGGMRQPAICVYRSYRSDRPDMMIDGPLVYGIYKMPRDEQSTTFEIRGRPMNYSGTGLEYDLDKFQMRSFI